MPRHKGLPRPESKVISKKHILQLLLEVDANEEARARVLKMETRFRHAIETHVGSLPTQTAQFERFKTNPFVLLFHAFRRKHTRIAEIEGDILPAKLFSSMETSAGRMVQEIVLPYVEEFVLHTGSPAQH